MSYNLVVGNDIMNWYLLYFQYKYFGIYLIESYSNIWSRGICTTDVR